MAQHVGVRAGLDGVAHARGLPLEQRRVKRVAVAGEHRVDADPQSSRFVRQRRRNGQGVELGELRRDRQRRRFVLQIPFR